MRCHPCMYQRDEFVRTRNNDLLRTNFRAHRVETVKKLVVPVIKMRLVSRGVSIIGWKIQIRSRVKQTIWKVLRCCLSVPLSLYKVEGNVPTLILNCIIVMERNSSHEKKDKKRKKTSTFRVILDRFIIIRPTKRLPAKRLTNDRQ